MTHHVCSDVLLLPSAYEGVASVLYEAMASGLAVVTSSVGGHAELVTDDTGLLGPPVVCQQHR